MYKPFLSSGEDASSVIFEVSYERYFNMVYQVCFSYLKNAADAEDAVADVFEKLLKHGLSFKNAEHEKAWLLRTAINHCKDVLKHWWRMRANIDDYENLETADPYQGNELMKLILELPDRYKDVVYLYYYEGYSTVEIAKMLRKPKSTIRNHLHEARGILKGAIEDEE
jgi:RNA polymerase sigma-70 factor (ECF subfamily)